MAVAHGNIEDFTTPRQERSGWFLALGILLLLCGIAAMVLPMVSTYAVSRIIALVLIIGGAGHLIQAFQTNTWKGFAFNLLTSLVELVGGILIWMDPFAGALAITVVIAAVFVAAGVTQLGLALRVRPQEGWGTLLLSGMVSLIAGAWLFFRFPVAGLFAPGLIVGVALFVEGLAFISLSSGRKRAVHA
jgi:uncharacterized membrane protein HdeD (DUF308 family)